jgi:predicted dehydrogenase
MLDTKPDSPTPKGVDYKSWLGPAPMRPFNENRFHFNFRWYWDYAGGLMTDWGVHEIDIALFGMKVREPKSIVASGGRYGYPNQDTETPDTLQTLFEYDNFTMLWENAVGIDGGNYGQDEGIAFIGNNGTLQIDRGGWQVISEKDYQNDRKLKLETVPYQKSKGSGLDFHTKNFVESIRNNDPNSLACGIDSGSIACINAHMGNISYKVGRKIFWDKESQNFGKDKQANALISPSYNNGFKLPS